MASAGITLDLTLPLAFTPRERFDGQELADWMRGNVAMLQALASLESSRERDGESGGNPLLARLEAKIDLTLTLVGELLRRQTPLPPATAMALTSQTIAWEHPQTLAPHSQGVVSLYVSPRLPWPLKLPVEIIGTQDGKTRAKLIHLSEEAQEWLDRTLFRHHRRAVHARAK
ncbi:PilZ domain-containing protein [Thiobacter aerophilum]|uniref:PilZ domain-containing protein n=1 Tax=Thiobacter aerophilum TaxID=3121275 RepID=A0ABV0EAY6_9BURK